ncbi:MAG: OmpA family protein, partial [Cyclobacteriaceae bacterium]
MRFALLLLLPISMLGQVPDHAVFKPANSKYDELSPVVSPDGRTLFVTVANHPANIGGVKDPGDIWISVWAGNQWGTPSHGGSVLNDRGYNGVAGISADGQSMYLFNHYGRAGANATTQGIAMSTWRDGRWGTPENIAIPYFLNREAELTGSIAADGSAFVFAAEGYDTKGAEDLHVTLRKSDGTWTEPRNLSFLNTRFQELSPWLAADGRKLYFATNGREGYGSFDIFVAERLDDSWQQWSTPQNLGPAINTDGRELFFRNYQSTSFLFTSTKDSDGYGDIRLFDPVAAPDTLVRLRPADRTVAIDNEVVIRGTVTNAKTGESVTARIHIRANETSTAVTNRAGQYQIKLPASGQYVITVEAPRYVSVLENLDIHTIQMKVLEMNFRLQPVEVGTTVNLKSVLFEQGTTTFLSESYAELDLVADFMKTNPRVAIELAGHTDNRGNADKNKQLSKDRVEKVKQYLVSK